MPPFTSLTQKDQFISWGVEVDNAFKSLNTSFTIASLLIHVNPSKPFVLETNAIYFIVGAILSQLGEDNLLHLVNFRFCKSSLSNINYEIHDK